MGKNLRAEDVPPRRWPNTDDTGGDTDSRRDAFVGVDSGLECACFELDEEGVWSSSSSSSPDINPSSLSSSLPANPLDRLFFK